MKLNEFSFKTDLDQKQTKNSLEEKVPDISWSCHESEYQGNYVVGKTQKGIEIVIILDDESPYLYCDFPNDANEKDRILFDDRIQKAILPAIGAHEIRRST